MLPPLDATNASKHSSTDQLIKFFLPLGQSNALKHLWLAPQVLLYFSAHVPHSCQSASRLVSSHRKRYNAVTGNWPPLLYAAAAGRVRAKQRDTGKSLAGDCPEARMNGVVAIAIFRYSQKHCLARGVRSEKFRRKLVVRHAESLFRGSRTRCTSDRKLVAASLNVSNIGK